jgi:2',3'-cyclic-nucleotide 2'-phosphodiesterase (5'-nucleotidase family)
VDIAVTNNGGLRATIKAGPITLRSIIEVMPFENRLMIVRLTGAQLMKLVEQIAARGGVPQSGLKLTIRDKKIVSVTVGEAPIDEERVYVIVTTDYLYKVGGKMSAFQLDPKPTDTCLVLREVLVKTVKERKTITPRIDGRTVRLRRGSK